MISFEAVKESVTVRDAAKGYFDSFAAPAFVGKKQNGVMIRTDLDFPEAELFRIFLHELSHLYCCRNEIEGGDFLTGTAWKAALKMA